MKAEKQISSLFNSKRLLLITTSGYRNIGQEAIVYQTIKEVLEKKSCKRIILTSLSPSTSNKIHLFDNVSFVKPISFYFLYSFIITKQVIVVGDEITSDRLDNYYKSFFNFFEGKFKLFVSLFSILSMKKLFFYKIGIYSFQKNFPKKLFRYVLNNSEIISVRDTFSKKVLDSLNLRKEIMVLKDPGYDLNIKRPKFIKKPQKKVIGLALYDPLNKKKEDLLILFLEKLIRLNKDQFFEFYVFSKHPYLKEENDLLFIKKILKSLNVSFSKKIFFTENPVLMKEEISKASFVISMRLHPAIFADSLKIPFLVIATTKKTTHFFNKNKTFTIFSLKPFKID